MTGETLQNVAIVGAGVQGSMLAFRCALHGKRVALVDVDMDIHVVSKPHLPRALCSLEQFLA